MTRLPHGIDNLLQRSPVCVVDIGARGGWQRKWRRLRPWVTFVGFEPEPIELERLRSTSAPGETYLGEALSRVSAEMVLHHTRNPNCSSLYRPNRGLIQRLRPGDDQLDVVRSEPIQVVTLDDSLSTAGISRVDFIKIDTQGSELDILHGGLGTLERGVIGVEVEVEFLPLYEGQPLFSDVQEFMLSHGFELMGFPRTSTVADFRAAKHDGSGLSLGRGVLESVRARFGHGGTFRGAKQLLYADAIYLRSTNSILDLLADDRAERDMIAARAVLVCCANSYFDHAHDFVDRAHEQELMGVGMRADLRAAIRALSGSLPQRVDDLKRIGARLKHRFRQARR
jgi:FkbM family methyltransferase